MKRVKRILAMILCVATGLSTLTVQAADAEKEGLVKKGDSYYFYKDGEQVKNEWETVDGNRYYFGKDGKAYRATSYSKNKYNIVSKTIGTKKYGFDTKARLAKGVYVRESNEKFYYYNTRGVYREKRTKKLQSCAKTAGKYFTKYAAGGQTIPTSTLKKLQRALDKLLKYLEKYDSPYTKRKQGGTGNSCIAMLSDGSRYTDVTYTFEHFKMTTVIYPGTSYEILYEIYPR